MDLAFDASGRFVGVEQEEVVALGHYMMLADARLNLFTVFDDLKYDRSDIDMMSPPMRTHAVSQLKALGFTQTSGTVLYNKRDDVKCFIPKFHALGASPFDIARYTPKRSRDYYILTPTQTACQYIDAYAHENAIEKIVALVKSQPINLFKLVDYLEKKPAHRDFRAAIGYIKSVQREAVTSDPLRRRRALGSF